MLAPRQRAPMRGNAPPSALLSRHPRPPMSASPPPDPLEAFLTKVASTTVDTSTGYVSRFRYHPDGWILPSPAAAARIAYRNSLDEDSCMSFDEWKACGFFVKKGSKSQFTDALGIPQFTKEQVEKSKWRPRR